jgi:hypothetical protein
MASGPPLAMQLRAAPRAVRSFDALTWFCVRSPDVTGGSRA